MTSFGDAVFNFGREMPIRNANCHDYSQALLGRFRDGILCRPRIIAHVFIYMTYL